MALFDFYRLAVLYNLRCRDAEFLPNHSHPLPMSTTIPPHSSLTDPKAHSSLPLPGFAVPKTPRHRRDPATVGGVTPTSRGSCVQQKQEGDTDRVFGCDRRDYEQYIREDLSCRVFVDFEVFMKDVLHVPENWKTLWSPAIDAVKTDADFNKHHKKYCKLCEEDGTLEKNFYPPLMETANAVLDVVHWSNFEGIPSEKRQYYHVNDPKHVKGGVMDKRGLSPDLVLLHQDRPHPGSYSDNKLHWVNPLHVLEVKPYDNALCDGNSIPRLAVDGKCEIFSYCIWS